jgi:hypothetical protein
MPNQPRPGSDDSRPLAELEKAADNGDYYMDGYLHIDHLRDVLSSPQLRAAIALVLSDSTDRCPRCKTCDVQTDAVMAVLRVEDTREGME